MKEIFIRYKHRKTPVHLPAHWNLLTFAAFEDRPGAMDPDTMTRQALKAPIGSAPLRERLSPSDRVAVLVEDQTRASPKKVVLKVLLPELEEAGVSRENISVIVALGTHRQLSAREMGEVYGEDLVRDYAFTNHDCHAPDLVPVGKLKSGTPVKINRRVHEATFRLGVGSIFPHPLNGFGGGGKILFPGVSDFDAILEHHLKYCPVGGSGLGKLQGNPFYEEVSALSRTGGLDFIINSVLDHNDRPYEMVAGDPEEAHLAGIEVSRRIISMRFRKKADVTVISSFPYTEGAQIMKPLAPASRITKEGGIIILAADCTVPLSDAYVEGCERFRLEHADDLKGGVLRRFQSNRRIMEEGAPEFNMSMAQALVAQASFKVILVSEGVPREAAERLGFLFAEDLGRAFALAETFCPDAEVHVVPSGGVILPAL